MQNSWFFPRTVLSNSFWFFPSGAEFYSNFAEWCENVRCLTVFVHVCASLNLVPPVDTTNFQSKIISHNSLKAHKTLVDFFLLNFFYCQMNTPRTNMYFNEFKLSFRKWSIELCHQLILRSVIVLQEKLSLLRNLWRGICLRKILTRTVLTVFANVTR